MLRKRATPTIGPRSARHNDSQEKQQKTAYLHPPGCQMFNFCSFEKPLDSPSLIGPYNNSAQSAVSYV